MRAALRLQRIVDHKNRTAPDSDPQAGYWAVVEPNEARAMKRKEFREWARRRLRRAGRPKPEGYTQSPLPTISLEGEGMPNAPKGLEQPDGQAHWAFMGSRSGNRACHESRKRRKQSRADWPTRVIHKRKRPQLHSGKYGPPAPRLEGESSPGDTLASLGTRRPAFPLQPHSPARVWREDYPELEPEASPPPENIPLPACIKFPSPRAKPATPQGDPSLSAAIGILLIEAPGRPPALTVPP